MVLYSIYYIILLLYIHIHIHVLYITIIYYSSYTISSLSLFFLFSYTPFLIYKRSTLSLQSQSFYTCRHFDILIYIPFLLLPFSPILPSRGVPWVFVCISFFMFTFHLCSSLTLLSYSSQPLRFYSCLLISFSHSSPILLLLCPFDVVLG